ncbi:PIG-Y family protein [Aspergillus mulundensis]|uniref:Uncharacterized protein n=1 Tax=Aspergillus mulundensis TaxID=1810919 RepID=A0A3D8RRM8_9EURO|nr:hypothetical protein DSM5745_06600 [Aspergillus mulundensis]RDW76608.1 hypothetical protein DSM5745_06600 [Aspergillus mulundensis]
MEDANNGKAAATSLDNEDQLSGRTRSGSASSGHKRNSSGSLLSRLSFLRMMQASQGPSDRGRSNLEADDDRDDLGSGLRGARAMSTALQQRRTRRRRGSLRKTALLGTRFDYRDKKGGRPAVDVRGDVVDQHQAQSQAPQQQRLTPPPIPTHTRMKSFGDPVSPNDGFIPSQPSGREGLGQSNTTWTLMDAPQRGRKASASAPQHLQPIRSKENMLGEEVTTDDEDIVSFPPRKNTGSAATAFHSSSNTSSNSGTAGLRIPTPSSSTDSYYGLPADQKYRTTHRAKSPLATHAVDITGSQEAMSWDYSETEWWGWIILIVTWLVFVVGMGSCFGVWSWAWDVGETPYAPPELEDDPTLPIVGYYPALIVLTAVMSWVWVIIAWVGMKYFKHANITGDDT